MGDHAMNMIEYAQEGKHKLVKYELVKEELMQLENLLQKSYELIYAYTSTTQQNFEEVSNIEDQIDDLTAQFRENQIIRLSEKKVSSHDTVLYSEIMTDIERISDHMMNIIEECQLHNIYLCDELFDTKTA